MESRIFGFKAARGAIVALLALSSSALTPRALEAQRVESRSAVGIHAGIWIGTNDLGATRQVHPVGYLELGESEAAPALELAAVLGPPGWPLRLWTAFGASANASIPARWSPCDPGQACPAILIEPDVDIQRFTGVIGLELSVPDRTIRVRPYLKAGVGFRHYDVDWKEWGGEGTFHLPAGSLGETALLTSLAGGAAVDVFGFEARAEAGLDLSRFGRGVVPVRSPSPEGPFEVDLGRTTVREVMVRVGIFRPLG
jgi:hypothetical protein